MDAPSLTVCLNGTSIGHLASNRKGFACFQFDPSWASGREGLPMLSAALPVRERSYDAEATRNWFMGLLPEDERLDSVRRFFGAGDDWVDVLACIGWECAGAVEVFDPMDRHPAQTRRVLELTPQDLGRRIAALPGHPFDDASTMRMSLGGFQEKLCVILPRTTAMDDAVISLHEASLPQDGSPTTHILKPEPARFPGLAEAEAWGMTVAAHITDAAKTAIASIPGAPPTLVVERFDRIWQNGTLHRLHQEDCCQALGLSPYSKYASASSVKKSDPSLAGIARLLDKYANNPMKEKERLFAHMVTNLVVGNTDAHAKNYGFIHPDDYTIAMAPLYDVVPAREVTPNVQEMGMRIGGRIVAGRIGRSQVLEEGQAWGISSGRAARMLDALLSKAEAALAFAGRRYPRAAQLYAAPTFERIEKLAATAPPA